jgi:outer membrane protein assembly factor BamB
MRRIAGIACVGTAVVVLAGCWPAPGAGPNRDSYNPWEETIGVDSVASLEVAWTADFTEGSSVTDPVLSADGVHTYVTRHGLETESLFTFRPDGSLLWSRTMQTADYGPGRSITTDGGRMVVSVMQPEYPDTWIFDTATGDPAGPYMHNQEVKGLRGTRGLVWSTGGSLIGATLDDDIYTPGGEVGGYGGGNMSLGVERFYQAGPGLESPTGPWVNVTPNGVRAFPTSGLTNDCGPTDEPYWLCPTWVTLLGASGNPTPPVIGPGETAVYVGTESGDAHGLDAATGDLLWTAPVGSPVDHPPALAEGTLFVPTRNGELVALDAATGTELWRADTGSRIVEQPAVAGGVVFTASSADWDPTNGSLRAFDATDGSLLWQDELGSRITGAPAISGGNLYVGTQDGRLLAYSPTT